MEKEETLEEAALRCYEEMMAMNPRGNAKSFIRIAVNFGVAWQAERSISLDEMSDEIIDDWLDYRINNVSTISFKDWFKQFKNK